MVKTIDEFIAGMRRNISRWKADIAVLEAQGAAELIPVVNSWLEAGEKIIASHEIRYA